MAFVKGVAANPNGRPKGSPNKRPELLNAIKYVQGKKGKKLLVHAIEQAYEDNTVLVAVLRKLIPDLKAVELTGKDGGPVSLTGIEIVLKTPGESSQANKPHFEEKS